MRKQIREPRCPKITVDAAGRRKAAGSVCAVGIYGCEHAVTGELPWALSALGGSAAGEGSAFAANTPKDPIRILCGANLAMPTTIVAQNGAEIHEFARITVTGCPNTEKAAKKSKAKKARKASSSHSGQRRTK